MMIRSLGRRTDLIFAKFSGRVIDKGSYTLVQTPSNPGYHWGNYIIFDQTPKKGSLKEWTAIFDKEFSYYIEPHHYVFTWDTGVDDKGEYQEFLEKNFEFGSAAVLIANKLSLPKYLNNRVQVRKISTDQSWNDVTGLQILCEDPKFMSDYYEQFKRQQIESYRRMSEAGRGAWYGAFIENQLVGDLGIFYEGKVGRYQSVETHPKFRKQGVCGTLVYKAGLMAFKEFGVDHLVMEADVEYHAARIYESVGFERNEVNHALSWWRGKNG